MKRVFLVTTALVMSAGMAVAEVSIGGDARMGIRSDDGGDAYFDSRIRISFSASGETDGGISFGGSIRADNAGASKDGGGSGANGQAGSVYVDGPFGMVSMGDVGSAAKQAVGHANGVGYTGLGDKNELNTYIGDVHESVRWDYTMGALKLYASTDQIGQADNADSVLSGAMSYSIGDVGFAAGVERKGDEQHVSTSVSASLGDASIKLAYGSSDDGMAGSDNVDSYGASAAFNTGMATFKAFASNRGGEGDYFGIGAEFDLGGGAAIKGGFVDGDMSDGSFDLGISMSF